MFGTTMMGIRRLALLSACAIGTVWAVGGGSQALHAAPENRLSMELNRVETVDSGCQTTLVMTNDLSQDIADLGIELVLFDTEGIVNQFVLLTSGPLPAGRTRVKAFMLEQVRCEQLQRILVNGVTTCSGGEVVPETCSRQLSVTSRAPVSFEF